MRLGVTSSVIAASLAAHAAFFYFTERAFIPSELKKMQAEQTAKKEASKKAPLDFEFVEAPRQNAPAPLQKTRKVSNRDALNQDLRTDKTNTVAAPAVKTQGPSDQLEQKKGSPAAMPQPQQEYKPPLQKIEPPKALKQDETDVIKSEETVAAQPQPSQKPQTASQSQTATQVSSGGDKITTQEMSRSKSVSAQLFGATSFEATGSGMGVYMKNLKEKIWLAWYPYLAFKYPQDFKGADVIVSFVLNAKGELKMIRVEELSGSPMFSAFCLEAVQRAAPGFGTVPPEILDLIGKDQLEIQFGFHYR